MVLALTAATGCSEKAPISVTTADQVIRQIYAADVRHTQQLFTSDVQPTITAASVNRLSNLMHAFGNYEYITEASTLGNGRYDLEAQFARGSMLVQLRLDSSGNVAALHIIPNAPT